jgi:threonine/homoserine/homoserine lactone efflux protein
MDEVIRNMLLGISLAAPIGPSSVAVIQNGLHKGFMRAFLTGIGVTMADATYMLVVYFGLSGFVSIPVVKILIWFLGAIFLLYLGVQSIGEAARRVDFEAPPPSNARNPLLVGYLINISNPIAVVWWLGIFGSLLGAAVSGLAKASAFFSGASILAGILIWHSTVSVLSHGGKRFLNARTAKYISLIAGAALILFGLRFGYNAIHTLTPLLAGLSG